MAAPDFMLNRNDGKNYYAYAVPDERGIINFEVYDAEDPKTTDVLNFFDDGSFVRGLSNILDQRFKGIVLQLFEYQPKNFSSNYEFCSGIRNCLASLKIPCHFVARTEKNLTVGLIGANLSPKIGDTLLGVSVGVMNYICFEYKFTEIGWSMVRNWHSAKFPESDAATQAKIIMNGCDPSYVIAFSPFNWVSTSQMSSIMKGQKNFTMVSSEENGYKYPGEMVKWMHDKSYTKCFVQPISWKNTGIVGVMGKECLDLFGINWDTILPTEKSCVASKFFSHYLVLSINENNKAQQDRIATQELSKKCHQTEITVAMNTSQFLDVKTKEIILPEIETLPKKMDETLESKIPVIGFFEYSSVICVAKDGEKYKFLEQWGGLYGNELFINFETEPTQFGSNAIIPFKTSMNSVIFDLIKIMSMPVNNIKKDTKWRFKITKDDKNPLLLEFVQHDGTTGTQIPEFFMAMLIKEQLRKIKEELGEKPKEIGICFFDKFNVAERKRLEAKLQESCALLKLACTFVNL